MFKLLIACISIGMAYSVVNNLKNNDDHAFLTILYQTKGGFFLRKLIASNKWFSVLVGKYCDSAISKCHIDSFVKKHNISLEESEKTEFTSFNDFFIRKLKPDTRPVDQNPNTITSPADGKIMILENIDSKAQFPVKGVTFSLESFLHNKELAEKYIGGTLLIIRLDPWDYHRFHIPIDGYVSKAIGINGKYESVNPIVYHQNIQVLSENERHLFTIRSTECDEIVMVPVGALCVGKIIETYKPEQFYQKGDELGYFAFGGSTVVLLFKKDTISINSEIVTSSLIYQEMLIKMGSPIGTLIKK